MKVFAQPACGYHPWVFVTPGLYTEVQYGHDVVLHYTDAAGDVIASDTIPAGVSALTIVGTGMPLSPTATFDNTYLWYVFTVIASNALSLVLASQLPNIETLLSGARYAVLGRVLSTALSDYEQ